MSRRILALGIIFFFVTGAGFSLGGNPPPRAVDHAVFGGPSEGSEYSELDSIDDTIEYLMQIHNVPGLTASLVTGNGLLWASGYGLANVDAATPVEVETLFMLASVSKVVTGTALMQLHEDGLFELDDDINAYLPFNVRNPWHQLDSITFRMLLTHTSSIKDNWDLMPYYSGDSPIPLGEYLEDYLSPGGDLYDPHQNFNASEPGTTWDYCNIAIALVGYLVETISGIPFNDYCQQNIFAPLQMNETAWYLADLNPDHIAMPYSFNGVSFVPYGHYGYSDYPAGQLRTSADQLGRFLAAYINDGQFDGHRILEAGTVDLMLSPQIPDINPSQGLVWRRTGSRWGHGGGDQGVRTTVSLDPAEQTGVVVLTNGESTNIVSAVAAMLFTEAISAPGSVSGLTVSKTGVGMLELAWDGDCGGGSSYAVYRGEMASGYDSILPEPGLCEVGETSVLIPEGPGTGDFLLVVPVAEGVEGSYGTDSEGDHRAQSSSACFPQELIHDCAP